MNKSGRLIVVQSVTSAVPIYTVMADDLPAWAVEEIDALRRAVEEIDALRRNFF
jgi:hypothetical protein